MNTFLARLPRNPVLGVGVLLAAVCPAWAEISVTIRTPGPHGLAGDPFRIAATVASTYELADVKATVDGAETTMVFSSCAWTEWNGLRYRCREGWVATVPTAGMPRGEHPFTVTARDVLNSTTTAQSYGIFDRKPAIEVTSPLQHAVATPTLRVLARCRDDDPRGCAQIVVEACGVTHRFSGSLADAQVPGCVDELGIHSGNVSIYGVDYRGQLSTTYRTLGSYTELSPALRAISTVDGLIVDVRGDRVLYVRDYDVSSSALTPYAQVRHISSGATESVPMPAGFPYFDRGILTSRGALFRARTSADGATRVFEWRDGASIDLGPYGAYFDADGDYAAWVSDGIEQQTLVLRNTQTGTTATAVVPTGVVALDVGPNGDVVFLSGPREAGYDVFRYRSGTITQLTSTPAYKYSTPLTDGRDVSYTREAVDDSSTDTATMLYDTVERVLTTPGTGTAIVNNGWALYRNLGGTGIYQVVRRSPAGAVEQLSFFATSSAIRALAPNGDALFWNHEDRYAGGGLYLATPGAAAQLISRNDHEARSFFVDDRWYLAVGNTLFQVSDRPCAFGVSPTAREFGSGGGTALFTVMAESGCGWTTSGVPSWVTVYAGHTGGGPGSVRLGIARNTGGNRVATLTVAGQIVTIRQGSGVPTAKTRSDFTGDGAADRAVFRPHGGMWITEGLVPIHFGQSGYVPVPADYDGNGTTDIAAFDPSTARWLYVDGTAVTYGAPGDVPVPADYNGDGRADVAVFRPAHGRWYVKDQLVVDWGLPGDIPVPADYDGDGRTDIAVFRPSTGMWYLRGIAAAAWGVPGDMPVPADYDGDGRADVAVYRRGTGVWYVRGQFTTTYGLAGDLPVPLDVDGDGRANVSVYRRSTGQWFVEGQGPGHRVGEPGDLPLPLPASLVPYTRFDLDGDRRPEVIVNDESNNRWLVQQSGANYYGRDAFSFGIASDIRRAADFDGDGRGDLTLFRPSTGDWYSLPSSSGFIVYVPHGQWGLSTDVALPADYDGDRKADLMVFRTGHWFLRTSASGFTDSVVIHWGLGDDRPVPADYDGDGRMDVAVFRPSQGRWFIKRSSDGGLIVVDWGLTTDTVAPADFDGDGRTDVAVFRPSTGAWWIKYSATDYSSYATINYGAAGDVPVPGDYNGDGLDEPAFFRPGSGVHAQHSGIVYSAGAGVQQPVTAR